MDDIVEIRRVAIVGARGRMGGLFKRRCEEVGIEVRAIDRPLTPDKLDRMLDGVELVLVSVPVDVFASVLDLIAPRLRPPQILCDNVSVKVVPLAEMLRRYAGPIVATHPLFGPEPPPDARVALVAGRDEALQPAVEHWIARLGFASFRCTAEEHDQAMALVQNLNFVTTVSYLAALAGNEEFKKYLTPSFARRLDAASKMLTTDAQLFTTLFEANPYSQEAVRRFRNMLHVAAGGDIDILVERARWWWKDEPREQ